MLSSKLSVALACMGRRVLVFFVLLRKWLAACPHQVLQIIQFLMKKVRGKHDGADDGGGYFSQYHHIKEGIICASREPAAIRNLGCDVSVLHNNGDPDASASNILGQSMTYTYESATSTLSPPPRGRRFSTSINNPSMSSPNPPLGFHRSLSTSTVEDPTHIESPDVSFGAITS
jgi:hypothetical protein